MNDDVVQLVKERINIVEIISEYFPLKKAGTNFKACCPFHQEKTPSFSVNETKQMFYCFGCKKGGDVITFVRDYEKISYPEALRKLAIRAGITLKESKAEPRKNTHLEMLFRSYELANAYFKDNLQQFGSEAMAYLAERKISNDTIEKFDIGYSLNSFSGLKNYLLKQKIDEKDMAATGLFIANDDFVSDMFRGRIMFPIHSIRGRIVAFGGRNILPDQKGGKYINTPTTEIYQKGDELYGLHLTKYEISKKGESVICEGYLDFLRLFESGITNSVASLGTALTVQQINLLGRYATQFNFLYDGDSAGRKAALKAGYLVLKEGYNARVTFLPKGEDPDSFVLNHGIGELVKMIESAEDYISFVKNDTLLELSSKERIEYLIDLLKEFDRGIDLELLVKKISEVFNVSEIMLKRKITQKKKISPNFSKESTAYKFREESYLIHYLINYPHCKEKVCNEINRDYFFSHDNRDLFETLVRIQDITTSNPQVIIDSIEDEIIRSKLIAIIFADIPENIDIDSILTQMKIRKYQSELKELNEKINLGENGIDFIKEKINIQNKLKKLSTKVVSKTIY